MTTRQARLLLELECSAYPDTLSLLGDVLAADDANMEGTFAVTSSGPLPIQISTCVWRCLVFATTLLVPCCVALLAFTTLVVFCIVVTSTESGPALRGSYARSYGQYIGPIRLSSQQTMDLGRFQLLICQSTNPRIEIMDASVLGLCAVRPETWNRMA